MQNYSDLPTHDVGYSPSSPFAISFSAADSMWILWACTLLLVEFHCDKFLGKLQFRGCLCGPGYSETTITISWRRSADRISYGDCWSINFVKLLWPPAECQLSWKAPCVSPEPAHLPDTVWFIECFVEARKFPNGCCLIGRMYTPRHASLP